MLRLREGGRECKRGRGRACRHWAKVSYLVMLLCDAIVSLAAMMCAIACQVACEWVGWVGLCNQGSKKVACEWAGWVGLCNQGSRKVACEWVGWLGLCNQGSRKIGVLS